MNLRTPITVFLLILLASCNGGGGGGGGPGGGGGTTPPVLLKCAVARVAKASDLLPGQVARGTVGDIVIENDKFRAIIQKGGRNWYNISQFGGNIIDALPKDPTTGALLGTDQFEEFVLGTNIESGPNYQVVKVVQAGGEDAEGNCLPAIVRAEGFNGEGAPDDLIDFINGSSAIRDLSVGGVPLQFPPGADDIDLPLTFATDYTLEFGKPYLKIDTHMINDTADAVDVYLVEYVNGSGELELFQHGYGFGEAFATAPCDVNRCNFMAYAGHEGGSDVSYGIIHKEAGSSTVSVSGVSVFFYGRDMFTVATTPESTQANNPDSAPNFSVPPNDTLPITRYFAVGNGTVSSIVDVRNELHELATGTIEGTITETDGGAPVAGAEIVMVSSGRDGFGDGRGPTITMVNHFRTDASGKYSGTYPPGDYTLEVNMPGRLAATPAGAVAVSIAADTTTTQDFTLPKASGLRVTVVDADDIPIAAKVQLVGDVLGPDSNEPRNADTIIDGNRLGITTSAFGDHHADKLEPGIALSEYAVLDTGNGAVTLGDTGEHLIEPGTYQLSVSHGPRYSHFTQEVTITEGQTTEVAAQLARVMDTPNHIYADFHVHSIASPDSEVTNRERVATYLAEGMDFFTPSDHGMRVDFSPIVADMGVGGIIATAPSAEVTTFDYGHFNFWPMKIETDRPCDDFVLIFGGTCATSGHSTSAKMGRGATDWGGLAPLGEDFPSAGNYSKAPADIFIDAAMDPFKTGESVVRQINHIEGHFGVNGLRIDTGTTGTDDPQSGAAPASKRLDPSLTNLYSDDYDSLEVLIGTDGPEYQNAKLYEQNLGDWFNLLNKGMFHTAISNSDTHTRRTNSMHTRNVISVPESLLSDGRANPTAISANPHGVGDSVITGLTSMTTAPFLRVKATKDANTAGLEVGDAFGRISTPLASGDGTVTLKIDIDSPIWAPYDQILVFVNGETVRHTDGFGMATSPPRYEICGPAPELVFNLDAEDFVREEVQVVAEIAEAKKYTTSFEIPVTHAAGDFWISVMVRGTEGNSEHMFPVVPNNDPSLAADGIVPDVYAWAMSNPIFVDVDGGGWDAPGAITHTGAQLPPDPCPSAMPAP